MAEMEEEELSVKSEAKRIEIEEDEAMEMDVFDQARDLLFEEKAENDNQDPMIQA